MARAPEIQSNGEELSATERLKVLGALGVALVSEVVGATGIEELNPKEAVIGFGAFAISALYAIKHMSPQTRREIKDVFRR